MCIAIRALEVSQRRERPLDGDEASKDLDSVRPAERALACHSARSASLARTFTQTARPVLTASRYPSGGQRGHGPPQASLGDARSVATGSMLTPDR